MIAKTFFANAGKFLCAVFFRESQSKRWRRRLRRGGYGTKLEVFEASFENINNVATIAPFEMDRIAIKSHVGGLANSFKWKVADFRDQEGAVVT